MSKKTTTPAVITGTFTNSAGEVYTVYGLSPLLPNKIMASIKNEFTRGGKSLPVCPTYIIPATDAHSEEIHEHDEKSILEGTPEEVETNKTAWKEYQESTIKINREYNSRIMKAVLLTVQAQPTQDWRDRMKFIGAELPLEGSPQEIYLFVETNVIKCPVDLSGLTLIAFQSAGIIKEEMTTEVEATFRDFMERAFIEAGRLEDTGK
jgi:hypothetical protein